MAATTEVRYQVGEVWKGQYSSDTTYRACEVVQDPDGSGVYRSLKSNNINHPLSDTTWWMVIIDLSDIQEIADDLEELDTQYKENEEARQEAEEERAEEFATFEERIESKADKNGYYSSLTAGAAENLIGHGSVPAGYTYRTSGGTASIGTGAASIKEIKGNSIVWNQLVDNNTESVTLPSGNKYLIVPGNTGGADYSSIQTSDGTAISVTGGEDMLIDLTRMFGAGREPATVAEFRAMYPSVVPDNILPYDSGSILNLMATGVKTTGFNQWDEVWEPEQSGSFARIKSKNYCKMIAGQQYYVNGAVNNLYIYDAQKNAIQVVTVANNDANRLFTAPAGAAYFLFIAMNNYGTTYKNDICISLSWSGYRNGEYEPYEEHILNLPITTLTGKLDGEGESVVIYPDGMMSAGTAHDSLREKVADVVMKMVNLGDLTGWAYNGTLQMPITAPIPSDAKDYMLTANVIAICSGYDIFKSGTTNDKNLTIQSGYIRIKDSGITASDIVDGKIAKLNGVMLVYELATPKHYILDTPLNLNYSVNDFGTEMMLPDQTGLSEPTSAPIRYEVQYAMNAVDTLRRLHEDFIGAADFDKYNQALITAGILGSYSRTYNRETGEHDFTITAPSEGEPEE